jgi:methionine-rich copper-binding protein CopC
MRIRNVLAATSILLTLIASAPAASAHAALESTIPAKGAIVSASTNRITMLFGEDILVIKGQNPNSITVSDSRGKKVSTGRVKISGMKISVALKAPLKTGGYKVNYRVVSADGHVVTGSYNFSVK